MKKTAFKLKSGNNTSFKMMGSSPMHKNGFFSDFKKEISDNVISRSKAWKKTKPVRRVVGKVGKGLWKFGMSWPVLSFEATKEISKGIGVDTDVLFRAKNWGFDINNPKGIKKGIQEGIKFQKNKNIRKFNIFSPDPLNLKGPRPGSDEWKNQFKS